MVERRETVHRTTGSGPAATDRGRRSSAGIWVLLLALVVAALAWYALSRGEPAEVDMPEVEAPDVDLPEDEPNIEVNVDDGGEE